MGRKVTLSIVAPDSEKALFTLDARRLKAGETIACFIDRSGIDVHSLPTICRINGKAVLRPEWETRRLKGRDRVEFLARPGMGGMGGGGSSSGAKSIGAVVALVALTVLAPWAGGAMAGALGLGGATLGGVAYSSIFSGIILAGGSLLISQFLKPKTGGNSNKDEELYTISASGNQARPQQLIPVGYGRRLQFPDFAAPPYSIFEGDDQWLYQLFVIGCGEYDVDQLRSDDTIMWAKASGFHPAFAGCQLQIVPPGQRVKLFPINVVTASEVNGIQLPSPSKDPLNNGWVGGFVVNPPDTLADELWFDIVWPSGMSQTYKDRTFAHTVPIHAQARTVDAAGAPTGSWFDVLVKNYSFNKDQQIRVTEKVAVPPGRYMVRMKRTTDSATGDDNFLGHGGKVKAHDDTTWAAVRAVIDGPDRFPGVTTVALKAKATANLSAVGGRRIATVQTRKIPVWTGTQWVTQATRNPVWAALDIWTNADYGPALSMRNIDFQTFYQYALFFDSVGHTFDHFFTERTSVAEAIETALRVGRANPSFVGDRMLMVRDEPRAAPRQLFTDNQVVRGSLSVTRRLIDEEWADGVVIEYFDERNWKIADVSSAPIGTVLQRPARIQIPGLTKRQQAVGLARHMAAVNLRRRMEVNFQIELEGRMLKRMDQVLIQSDLPRRWGQGGRILGYDAATRRMTLEFEPRFEATGNHYLRIRRSNGRPWGPVRVSETADPNVVVLDIADILAVEAQQGTLAAALTRTETQEPLSATFSQGSPRELKVLVTKGRMRGRMTTIDAIVDDPLVYTFDEEGVPPPPDQLPNFQPAFPLIEQLAARAYQRAGTIVLQVGWAPTPGAIRYVIGVSFDNGTTWSQIYNDAGTNCEAIIGGAQQILVRGAVVNAQGIIGNYKIISVEAPPVRVSNEFFIMEVTKEDFQSMVRRELEFQPLLQPVALQVANTTVIAHKATANASAAIKRIEEVRVDSEQALAAYGTIVEARFEENEAYVQDQIQALSGPGGAIASLEERVNTRFGEVESNVTNLIQTRVTADEASALIDTKLSAKLGNLGTSTVEQHLNALVTPEEASAIAQTQVNSALGTYDAGIQNTLSTKVTTEQATAIADTRVNAKVGDLGGVTVKQSIETQASRINGLYGRYSVTIDAGGYLSGFDIVTDTGQNAGHSEFKIVADKFMIGAPAQGFGGESVFTVATRNGVARVTMRGDFIADGSVNAPQINVGSLSAISANIGAITSGNQDYGFVKIIGNSWEGARIEVWDG